MTPILTHAIAFILGFLIATLIMWSVNRKQQQDWQAEYRRLMSGIKTAYDGLDQGNIGRAMKILSNTYYGNVNWPRK